jgi:hypothetical protein
MKKAANYQEFSDLPEAWTRAKWKGHKVINEADPMKWSGRVDPPKVGDKVTLYMNDFGTGTVQNYFVEYGWLGILVKLDNPPAWYVKQNKGNAGNPPAHFFGVDLTPRNINPVKEKENDRSERR